jgi:hypothetical protein
MTEYWGYQKLWEEPVIHEYDGNRTPIDEAKERFDDRAALGPFEAPSREKAQVILKEHCRREDLIRRVIHTSVEEGVRYGIKKIDDVEILKACLEREQNGSGRVSLIKPLQAKIKRLGG